jgi:hypothetical protein
MSLADYNAAKGALTRIPITVVKLTLDRCQNDFGIPPCSASGADKCYRTFDTCRDIDNFSRGETTLTFSAADAPLPFGAGERPYIKGIAWLPTEIKESITIQARVSITVFDEPDADVGVDPYLPDRPPPARGTFWKKLIARNPNYKGRKVEIYEGFQGLSSDDYQLRFSGYIENIVVNADETLTLECRDKLSVLDEVQLPRELNVGVHIDRNVDASEIYIYGTDMADLDGAGYVVIGDNIISYASKWVGTSTGTLYGCQWGQLGSAKAAIRAGDQVQQAKYIEPDHPFDILRYLISLAGFTNDDIDLDAFAVYDYETDPQGDGSPNKNGWRTFPDDLINFSAFISDPTKVLDLINEICDVIDARIWINEQSKVSIARNSPNKPGRQGPPLTDAANIIHRSTSVDLNDGSRITRCRILWRQRPLQPADESGSYQRASISIDADAESPSGFGDQKVKEILCRWINLDCAPDESPYETEAAKLQYLEAYVKDYGYRIIHRHRYASHVLELDVDIKDEAMLVGSFVRVSTDCFHDHAGDGLIDWPFQVVRRHREAKERYRLKLMRMPKNRLFIIAPDDIEEDFGSATLAEREFAYIAQNNGLMPDGSAGYSIY